MIAHKIIDHNKCCGIGTVELFVWNGFFMVFTGSFPDEKEARKRLEEIDQSDWPFNWLTKRKIYKS